MLSPAEGIIPALESAHAVAYAMKLAPALARGPDHRHQPLRPGGQGRGDHRRKRREGEDNGTDRREIHGIEKEGRKAFVAYLTAGDPDLETTRALIPALEAAGVDIVEIGVPFSDPTADGPVIQAASQAALKSGATLAKVLDVIAGLRGTWNPDRPVRLLQPDPLQGRGTFAGGQPPPAWTGSSSSTSPPRRRMSCGDTDPAGLAFITLIAPTTDGERARKILKAATGFVYYISVTGVTGTPGPDWTKSARTSGRSAR